jgi:cytochrome c oxidase subunit 2
MPSWFPIFPERASTHAGQVDALYIFLLSVCGLVAFGVAVTITYFAIRYRAKGTRPAVQIEGSTVLEITWSVLPLFFFMWFFLWGAKVYWNGTRPPSDSEEIYTVAKQWMWKFQHLNGAREINELHVPVGRDVMMTMVSQDVIHSFFVPAFRIKQVVLPGRYTRTWFRATKPGRYHLFCAEYCGTMHSGMTGWVIVMEPADYQGWLAGGTTSGTLAGSGEKLFENLGCVTCHRDDPLARGPRLPGLYGKPVKLADGRTVIADDSYIRESILNPSAKIVAGYQNIMPNFSAQLNEENVLSLVAYVKSLGANQTGAPSVSETTAQQVQPAGQKKGK